MPRPRTAIAAALLAASAITLGILLIPRALPRQQAFFELDPDQKQLLKDARAAYAPYPTLSFTEATTAADIQAILDAAPEQPIPAPTPQIPGSLTPDEARRHRADLSRLMAEFLLYTVVKQDPDAYAAWRLGRGDRHSTRDEHERLFSLTETWIELTGGPPSDDLTSHDIFLYFHERARSRIPPERRIVGFLDHPDAAFTQLWFDNQHIFFTPPYPEPLGEHWAGSQLAGGMGYFRGTLEPDGLYAVNEPILRARCGVILIDAGGRRQPLMLHAFRSPHDGHWNMLAVHHGNFDPESWPGLTW